MSSREASLRSAPVEYIAYIKFPVVVCMSTLQKHQGKGASAEQEQEQEQQMIVYSDARPAAYGYQRKLWLLIGASTAFYLVLFLTVPMAVQLMYAIVCDNIQGGEDCDSSAVSSRVASINIGLGLCNNIPSFLLSGFYASMADRYGR